MAIALAGNFQLVFSLISCFQNILITYTQLNSIGSILALGNIESDQPYVRAET